MYLVAEHFGGCRRIALKVATADNNFHRAVTIEVKDADQGVLRDFSKWSVLRVKRARNRNSMHDVVNDLAQGDERIVASLHRWPSLFVASGDNQHLIHPIALEIGAHHLDQAYIWLLDPPAA